MGKEPLTLDMTLEELGEMHRQHTGADVVSRFQTLDAKNCEGVLDILKFTYNGGYSSKQQRLTFEERRALRAKAYRALKALGAEK